MPTTATDSGGCEGSSMFEQEMTTSWGSIGAIVVSAAVMLVAVIVAARLVGLRTFAKMTTFDFAVTLAIGSLVAGTVSSASSLIDGLVAVGSLLALKVVIALLRARFGWGAAIDNRPVLLMSDGELVHENLRRARIDAADVRAKLRQANVLDPQRVRAVVLETTGDVSVLHGDEPLDRSLLDDVRC